MGQTTDVTPTPAVTAPLTPTEKLHAILDKVEGIAEADLAKLKAELHEVLSFAHKAG